MGFYITSAVFGGIIIILFGKRIAISRSCQGQCFCSGYGCGNVTCELDPYCCFYRNALYNNGMGIAISDPWHHRVCCWNLGGHLPLHDETLLYRS